MRADSILLALAIPAFGAVGVAIWDIQKSVNEGRQAFAVFVEQAKWNQQKTESDLQAVKESAKLSVYEFRREMQKLPPRPSLSPQQKKQVDNALRALPPLKITPGSTVRQSFARTGRENANLSLASIFKGSEAPSIGDAVPRDVEFGRAPDELARVAPTLTGLGIIEGRDYVAIIDPNDRRIVELISRASQ